ncbi:AMP-binding protein [Micromonospora sediminicola]|uniref:(2,3-dihydroxybenzoyl)adenylate synthase n=1 Tax=Micromonospora sediminicola TaxID=946078 RepID=UPI0033D9A1C4
MSADDVLPSRLGVVPWPDEAVARYVNSGAWEGAALTGPLLAAATVTPEAVALVDGTVRLTWRDLASRVDGAALRLRGLGLRADDRMVVQLPNSWEFVVLTLACLRVGVIPVMTLTAHRRHELSFISEHAQARAIAVAGTIRGFDHQAMARSLREGSATLEHVLVCGDDVGAGSVDVRDLCRPADDAPAARQDLDRSAPHSRDVALMLLSGGTTGLPKLIARTHDDYGCYVRRVAQVGHFNADTVFLGVLPLGHSLPLGMMFATLRSGGRVVIGASPSPQRVFATIAAEGVTVTAAVPAIVQNWLEHRLADDSDDLSSVRLLLVGGSRLADEVAQQLVPTLTSTLQQGYGMAEGLVCITRPEDPGEVTCHTQGRPLCDEDELMLVDEEGREVAAGEAGVLLTRGPCTPRGYYRAEEHNRQAFVGDGWLRTGDIVRRRADGNIVVEGREKDMINRGGEKVSAEEVENFAYQLPGVTMAAAVAMPDPVLGERVCLYVVGRPDMAPSLADVEKVMKSADVARFKIPERLVVVESLPMTAIGKIDKKALRVDIAARMGAEAAQVVVAS